MPENFQSSLGGKRVVITRSAAQCEDLVRELSARGATPLVFPLVSFAEPDDFAPVAGLRWHTRGSFVVAPPSRYGRGAAQWIREPGDNPLPDALRLLEFLADACDEVRV